MDTPDSSAVRSVDWEEVIPGSGVGVLRVDWRNGRSGEYGGVGRGVWDGLVAVGEEGGSAGGYLSRVVRGGYEYRSLDVVDGGDA